MNDAVHAPALARHYRNNVAIVANGYVLFLKNAFVTMSSQEAFEGLMDVTLLPFDVPPDATAIASAIVRDDPAGAPRRAAERHAERAPVSPLDRTNVAEVGTSAVPGAGRERSRSSTRPGRERRTVTKLVRLAPAEARRIERRALECGRPVACFLREAALGAAPRARRTAGVDPVIADLAHLGTTLRRLRDGANAVASDGSSEALRTTLDAVLGAVLETIRRVEQRDEVGRWAPDRTSRPMTRA